MKMQDLLSIAVESIETHGKVHPTVYVELDTGQVLAIPMFNFRGDNHAKTLHLFQAGRIAGQKYQSYDIKESCLLTESWVAVEPYEATALAQGQAVHHPQLEAIMIISTRNIPDYVASLSAYQIKRNDKQQVTELITLVQNADSQGSMVLPFSLVGIAAR